MPNINSSRDVIIRTMNLQQAVRFYEGVLGFAVSSCAEAMVGFETGAFRLYVEAGQPHGPVFDFLVADVQATKAQLISAGRVYRLKKTRISRVVTFVIRSALCSIWAARQCRPDETVQGIHSNRRRPPSIQPNR